MLISDAFKLPWYSRDWIFFKKWVYVQKDVGVALSGPALTYDSGLAGECQGPADGGIKPKESLQTFQPLGHVPVWPGSRTVPLPAANPILEFKTKS